MWSRRRGTSRRGRRRERRAHGRLGSEQLGDQRSCVGCTVRRHGPVIRLAAPISSAIAAAISSGRSASKSIRARRRDARGGAARGSSARSDAGAGTSDDCQALCERTSRWPLRRCTSMSRDRRRARRRLLASQFPTGPGCGSSASSPTARTTRSTGSARSWRCDCRGSTGRRSSRTRSASGCRDSLRGCRCQSPSRSLPVCPPRAIPGAGRSCRGSQARTLIPERLDDPFLAATTLGEFVAALERIDAAGGPLPGTSNSSRGVPLAERDAAVRNAIGELGDKIDGAAVTAAWEEALRGARVERRARLAARRPPGRESACEGRPAERRHRLRLPRRRRPRLRRHARVGVLLPRHAGRVPGAARRRRCDLGSRPRLGTLRRGDRDPLYEPRTPALAGVGRRAIDEVLADL